MIPVNLHPCDEMSWKTKLFDKELQLARLLHFKQIVIFVHNVFDLGECLSKAKHKNTTFFGLAQKKDQAVSLVLIDSYVKGIISPLR